MGQIVKWHKWYLTAHFLTGHFRGGESKKTVTFLKSTGQTVVYQIKGKAMFKTVLNERKFILTKTARFIFVGVDKVPLQ